MTAERWQRIQDLFEAGLELGEVEREALLRDACGEDNDLGGQVRTLWRQQQEAGDFLQQPALNLPAATQRWSSGEVIGGRFRITDFLAAGGMGEVYRANDEVLGRTVAIKVLFRQILDQHEARQPLEREARAISALTHPRICALHDLNWENQVPFLVMEYLEGETLATRLAAGRLPLPGLLTIGVQVAEGLAYAHRRGIIHRDLKPGNIMLTESGAKLLDFGLAKWVTQLADAASNIPVVAGNETHTNQSMIVGTIAYMSPEQAKGKPLDARSDIFSFGAVLYEMATGQRAFQGETRASTLGAVLRDDPMSITDRDPGIPPELEQIILRCLRKDPTLRFQSAVELKTELEAAAEKHRFPQHETDRASRPRSQTWLRWSAAALMIIAIALAVRWLLFKAPRPIAMMRPTPLTSYAGYEIDPSFSPDGKHVAFAWNGPNRNNFDIYVKPIAHSDPIRLTTNPARDVSPVWSPKGEEIAFLRITGAGKAQMILIPSRGGSERAITTIATYIPNHPWLLFPNNPGPHIAWTPDGRHLAVHDREDVDKPFGIFLITVATGEKRRLTQPVSPNIAYGALSFAPDGRSLAFSRSTGGYQGSIYRLDLNAALEPIGPAWRLVKEDMWNVCPAWTEDGREIIFAGGTFGSLHLFRMDASGGDPISLATTGDWSTSPVIHARSERMAYVSLQTDSRIWQARLGRAGEVSGRPTLLTSGSRNDFSVRFSPDGKKMAFLSDRGGGMQLWTSDRNGSKATPLTDFRGSFIGYPRWAPDSQRIVFSANPDGRYSLYTADAAGGSVSRLSNDAADDAFPAWSRDGNWIYFTSNRLQGNASALTGAPVMEIWRMPSGGGPVMQFTRNGGFHPQESPDQKWIYFMKVQIRSALWRMPSGGGEETRVLDISVYSHNWATTSHGIYFTDEDRSPDRTTIRYADLATGKVRDLVDTTRPIFSGLDISPDRRWITWSQFGRHDTDLMLVNNFR